MKVFFKEGLWIFDSGVIHGKRKRKQFDTYEQAKAYMDRAGDMRKKSGEKLVAAWLGISDGEMTRIVELRKLVTDLGQEVDWPKIQELTINYIKTIILGGVIEQALAKYITMKRSSKLAKDYVRRLERELGAFANLHTGKAVSLIVEEDVLDFVDSLKTTGGMKIADVTWNNRVRDLSVFFNYCAKKKWCSSDPTALIMRKTIADPEIEIFDLRELAVMFWVSEHHPDWEMTPYLSFGLWGSSRVCEAFRHLWKRLLVEEKALVVEEAASKGNHRRITEDLPDVLFSWIEPHKKNEGMMCPPETTIEFRRAEWLIPAVQKILPDFRWKDNGLRKTSISVHFAFYKDAPLTAAQHGTSDRMIFKTYRKVMLRSQAKPYLHLGRAEIVPLLRGLVPDEELDAWAARFPDKLTPPETK